MDLIAQDRRHTGSRILREPKLLKRVVIPKIEEYHAIANEVERFFWGWVNLLCIVASEYYDGAMSGRMHLLSDRQDLCKTNVVVSMNVADKDALQAPQNVPYASSIVPCKLAPCALSCIQKNIPCFRNMQERAGNYRINISVY
jgi:hypothetical protein